MSISDATDNAQPIPGQPEPAITITQVMNGNLDQLLADLGIRVIESSITDANFYGGVHIGNGRTTILTSPGRVPRVTDTLVRYLIAQTLGLDISPLPMPFEVEFTDFTDRVRKAVSA
ncbi:hypothetical protein AB0D73_22645 [Streptomyces sp. NPDC048215]|uniref:hypothetical protein n=1 Tax=Streptomyces TaxID=1883 RepID=UPI002E0F7C48|nr:hypothetical protein OG483_22790 [[Kitasatospora] papulosa]